MSDIKDPSLWREGEKKIGWVVSYMPVLTALAEKYGNERPFEGLTITLSIHLEAKTAYLCHVLRRCGARVIATGCNPLSTKDEICASLVHDGFEVFGRFGASAQEYEGHLLSALSFLPHIIIDDGGDLTRLLHEKCPQYRQNLIGGCEETTTGILRLKALERAGKLCYPMMAVNDAGCKHLFDNHHGTGQSTLDALMFTSNVMLSGKTVVVAGYGDCGSGIALRAKGMGANVIVTEINPFRALQAAMDGLRVMKMDDAAPLGDIFITATGCKDVIVRRHFEKMKSNVMLANSGHFDVEINLHELAALAEEKIERKPFIDGYYLPDGRVLNVLAQGRLVNISAGNGHPADIMDLSFAVQFMSCLYMARHGKSLENRLYGVPEDIDRELAFLKAAAMGLGVDTLTPEQLAYLNCEVAP